MLVVLWKLSRLTLDSRFKWNVNRTFKDVLLINLVNLTKNKNKAWKGLSIFLANLCVLAVTVPPWVKMTDTSTKSGANSITCLSIILRNPIIHSIYFLHKVLIHLKEEEKKGRKKKSQQDCKIIKHILMFSTKTSEIFQSLK